MVRHKRPKFRTRTVTKTRFRTRFAKLRSRGRSHRSSSMSGHATTILKGIGTGAAITTTTQLLAKGMGFSYPQWLNPAISFVGGLLLGKHHSTWGKALESGLAASATAYVEDQVISGSPLIPSLQSGGGGGLQSAQVF